MGQDESIAGGRTESAEAPVRAPAGDIENIEPFLQAVQGGGVQYQSDIQVQSGLLPLTDKMVMEYYGRITEGINRNEESITLVVQKQLEEYIKLAQLLERRRSDLDGRLASILSTFRAFDNEVKTTTELLKTEIEKADAIALEIGDDVPKFKDFQK